MFHMFQFNKYNEGTTMNILVNFKISIAVKHPSNFYHNHKVNISVHSHFLQNVF